MTLSVSSPSTGEWIKKMRTIEYYSAIKKEWNNAICSNMDGPRDDHTKWSKSDKDKYIIWYHLYVKTKMIPMTSYIK